VDGEVKAGNMTVSELIKQLQTLPQDYQVYYEGGDFKDNWIEVSNVSVAKRATEVSWGHVGVFLE
jgi:hypothetical protein